MRRVDARLEVAARDVGPDRQPAGPDGRVAAEHVQPAPSEAEVLHDVEQLDRLLAAARRRLVGDDQVDVDVRVDEVAVGAAPHRAVDAHQAVLLRAGRGGNREGDQKRGRGTGEGIRNGGGGREGGDPSGMEETAAG